MWLGDNGGVFMCLCFWVQMRSVDLLGVIRLLISGSCNMPVGVYRVEGPLGNYGVLL